MSFIELTNIDAGYIKGNPVLKEFHLSVEKGELVSLLGPSGCGKTTTLRTIAGFIMAERGKVVVGGRDYTNLPPNKRNIGLVFQNYALFPHLSVYENVAYGLKRRKVEKRLIQGKIEDVLKLVSLTGFEERLPAQLSGGQRQRVALARSIVIKPDLLLLDEPLSNLDAKLRDEMRAELSRLQHQLGITMIYVTHDQIEALSLSSRIIVMNEGNIEQIGTPEDIYERPETPFVARFIGFDNHLEGQLISKSEEELVVDVDGTTLVSSRSSGSLDLINNGDPVELYFRPDDTKLLDEEENNSIKADIDYANYQGNTTQYSLHVGESNLRAIVSGKPVPADVKSIRISIAPDKLIVEKKE
ncbi:MAG: ABC transporter ATP-binding protein [Spirochaetaceae bacterium]|nr:ABC transporter ATP-binding protein [Spirochaetaceae bacterium]